VSIAFYRFVPVCVVGGKMFDDHDHDDDELDFVPISASS
jgi:hypothetical protein